MTELEESVANKIKSALNWDDSKVELWFTTKSPFFGGMDPRSFMNLRPEKFEKIVNGLLEGNY